MLLVGVDGGGTKTAAWLGRMEHGCLSVIGKGIAGPSNPQAVGYPVALHHLETAIAEAFQAARLTREPVEAACLCIAGVADVSEHPFLQDWLKRHAVANRFRLAMDVEAVLAAAAMEDNSGIALISGTGSIAWGRTSEGVTARCGGWGYLLGDEGGGCSITLEAMRQACRNADGRSADSQLLLSLMKALNVTDRRQFIERIYDSEMRPAELAGLSQLVFKLSVDDSAAAAIVASAAIQLAELVSTTATKLGFGNSDFVLALAGGNLIHQVQYRDAVLASLTREYGLIPQSQLIEHPVAGALKLAQQLACDAS